MPTYQYACTACAERIEVVQRFSDDPLTVCPACGGVLRKVFHPVGVVFKGSGFYKTDSRSAARKSAEPAKGDAPAKPDAAPKTDTPSPTGTADTKPAAAAQSGGSGSSGTTPTSGGSSKVA